MKMRKADAAFIVAWVATAAATFFYACTMWFKMKLPYYYPTEHTWSLGKRSGVIAQGWYGKGLFALGAAIIVALTAWIVLGVCAKKNLSPTGLMLVGVVSTAVTVICMGAILYYEFHKWGIF